MKFPPICYTHWSTSELLARDAEIVNKLDEIAKAPDQLGHECDYRLHVLDQIRAELVRRHKADPLAQPLVPID